MLKECGILPDAAQIEFTTGQKLADPFDGPKLYKDTIQKMTGGGVLFIDEAYQLTPSSNGIGTSSSPVLNLLLTDMEDQKGKLVVILAGYKNDMEKLFEFNDGFPSRIPPKSCFVFEDFTDDQLLNILKGMLTKENLIVGDEKAVRIAARRLGRQRGQRGFGNARAVRNLTDLVSDRLSKRLTAERKVNVSPYNRTVLRDDLLGPKMTKDAMKLKSKAYQELQKMIGLKVSGNCDEDSLFHVEGVRCL
jgi:Cdc6-like AAA superfamily ATPase